MITNVEIVFNPSHVFKILSFTFFFFFCFCIIYLIGQTYDFFFFFAQRFGDVFANSFSKIVVIMQDLVYDYFVILKI